MACSIIIYFSSNGREHGPFALCVAVKSWSLDAHFVLFTSTILREKAVVVSDDITKHLLKSRTLFHFTPAVCLGAQNKRRLTQQLCSKVSVCQQVETGISEMLQPGRFIYLFF